MTARCPAGHDSTELDYCSVCGASMAASASAGGPSATAATQAAQAGACPSCGEARVEPEARFCEVCRFDFVAGKPGRAPAAVRSAAPLPAPATPAPAAPPLPPARLAVAPAPATPPSSAPLAPAGGLAAPAYVLVVETDAALDVDPDPSQPCPSGTPAVSVAVDRPEVLVGRRDDLRDVHPEIPLNDPGTSRRHGKFLRASDGSLVFQDLASTNGSKLNGVEVAAGSRSPLREGDEVTLGRWTRIRVTVRP